MKDTIVYIGIGVIGLGILYTAPWLIVVGIIMSLTSVL